MPGMTVCHAERNEALRLYLISWIPLILMAALLAVCLIVSKFSIRIDSLTLSAVLTGPLLAIAGLGLVSSRRIWGWRIGFVMLAIAQFGFLGTFAGPLSYIAAAAGFPLQDTNFARLDGLLGLDWLAYY